MKINKVYNNTSLQRQHQNLPACVPLADLLTFTLIKGYLTLSKQDSEAL